MGQQQLILLVLATVIVGVAIVVGIRAFTENDARANSEAMMQDAVRIGNDVQAWFKKPPAFGGPVAGTTISTATFATVGYQTGDQPGGGTAESSEYENLNGIYSIAISGDGVVITGESFEDDNATVRNQVQVSVCGTTDADITGRNMILSGTATGTTAPSCTTTSS
ncbi:MAG: hypothetical protein AAF845_05235 [Bacteroidota bacterium]